MSNPSMSVRVHVLDENGKLWKCHDGGEGSECRSVTLTLTLTLSNPNHKRRYRSGVKSTCITSGPKLTWRNLLQVRGCGMVMILTTVSFDAPPRAFLTSDRFTSIDLLQFCSGLA